MPKLYIRNVLISNLDLEAGNYAINYTHYASNPRIVGSKNVAFEDGGGHDVSAM